ncbi:MAG TPA: LamG-like jellyroll fold domain-containing protein [Conexibacter sp.]|nr:LamG-like jellyroll fold domain-containing protein [Conexibacter sp.]
MADSHMRPRLLTFLTLALLLASPAAAHAATLLYPNMRTLPPRELRFDRTDVSADSHGDLHNVLRFSNTVYNVGEGPVEIRATINTRLNPPAGPAIQRVYDDQGGFTDIPLSGSTLYYHDVHVHYHFDHWGGYELWTRAEYDAWIASGKTDGSPDLVGQKTTSCVTDEEFVISLLSAVWPADYPPARCMPDRNNLIAQGLSSGWGDTYDYYRFEQWIDLGQSTLPDGTYVLRSVSDPQNLVYESASKADAAREGSTDNSAITTFVVSGGRIADSDAPSGTVTINHVDPSTSTGAVSLDVLARDDVSGVRAFRVSNDGVNWRTYSNTSFGSIPQTISWDLTDPSTGGSNQSGQRTVCVLFQDNTGKWSPQITDTISFDPPAPPPPPSSAYGRAIAADRPLGWWRLGDTSGTAAVDQMGANNGTYSSSGVTRGQTGLVPADGDKAVALNGSTGYASVPAASLFNLGRAITLEAWIKPTSLPSNGAFRSVMTKAEAYSLQFNGPRLEFTVIQSGTRRRLQTPNGVIVAGGTYHVVGTFDGTTQRLYVNGTQVASVALSGSASTSSAPIAIGSWDGRSEFFNGTLDEAAVYGTVLSAAQVRAHYDAASAAVLDPPSGLTATARSPSQVDLGWFDNSVAETGQVLERSTDASFTSPTAIPLAANQQSYSDTNLTAGTSYWYRVKAVNGATSSSFSNVAQITTPAPASYYGAVRADLPVSYWRLGETSGTIAGDVTVANPGTYNGPPTLGAASLVGTDAVDPAVAFDGAGDDVRVGQSGSLDLTGALSLEAFVKPASLPAAGSFRQIVAKTGSYALDFNGPTLELTIYQLGVARRLQAPAGTIVAGRTYHVAGTFDGATQRLYVNGRQVASVALSGAADTTIAGLRIGSWDGAQQFFVGTLDEVALYNKALSASQVAAHFAAAQLPLGAPGDLSATTVSASQIDLAWADNAGAETAQVLQRSTDAAFSSPTTISLGANAQSYSDTNLAAGTQYWYRVRAVDASDSSAWSPVATATTQAAPPPASYASVVAADAPVGWWRLGETSGTTAANQAGGGAGTYAGGYTLNQPSLLATDMVNRAVAFNGSSSRVTVSSASALQLTNRITLEAWIKPTSLPSSGVFRSVMTKAESYSLQFNGPRLEFTVIQSGTRRRLQTPTGTIAAGGTYHVVGTFDGTTQRLYVNGAQVASVALSGSATTNTRPLVIGSWDGSSEFFAGTIDEPAVYNVVLSAAQVAAHHRAGTTG